MNSNSTTAYQKTPFTAPSKTASLFRMSTHLPLLLGVFLLFMSCDFNMDGKHNCKLDKDCIGERSCVQDTCIKRCTYLYDCSADEFCSLLDLDGEFVTACVSEDQCWDEDECPVGNNGSVCSREFVVGRPAGCINWGCTSATNCPASWDCLIDSLSSSSLGACSNGELGHPCLHDEDCNDPLICDLTSAACTEALDYSMPSEGRDE